MGLDLRPCTTTNAPPFFGDLQSLRVTEPAKWDVRGTRFVADVRTGMYVKAFFKVGSGEAAAAMNGFVAG
jgi:hypothetical protein